MLLEAEEIQVAVAAGSGKGWKCAPLPRGHSRWDERAILWDHQGPNSKVRGLCDSKNMVVVTFGWDSLGSSPRWQDKRTLC